MKIVQVSVPNTAIVGDSVDVYIILENDCFLFCTAQTVEVNLRGMNIPSNASIWAKPTIQPGKQQTVGFSFIMPSNPVTLWFEIQGGIISTTFVIVPKPGVNQPTIPSIQPTPAPGTAPPVSSPPPAPYVPPGQTQPPATSLQDEGLSGEETTTGIIIALVILIAVFMFLGRK